MKHLQKKYAVIAILIATVTSLAYCTKRNQIIDEITSSTDNVLYSMKVSAEPTFQPIGGSAWDGNIDAAWNNAKKLTVHAVVPDLGNGTFTGFIGNATDITMRSMYDANNIYYLVEWDSPQKNVRSAQWYFNPTTKLWAQESGAPALNADGLTFRPPFIQDQFVMMFNIANSCKTFISQSCYAACHVNSSYGGPITPEGGVMYTNGPNEFLDCWRARMLQVINVNQANDTYIDWGNGVLNRNEVKSDLQLNNGPVPIADGGFNNRQTITITGTTKKETIPLWVIPAGTYSNSAILLSDTLPGGAAVKVTAVDSNGVLTLANSTTIDPKVGTDYQQVGVGDGPKCIPGSIVAPYTGSRGDVTANGFYTGSGWIILLKRALKTNDTANDVDFSSLSDQPFGVGAMFNGADNQHAIVVGLMLHFEK